jgi:uncharacterized membrane protein
MSSKHQRNLLKRPPHPARLAMRFCNTKAHAFASPSWRGCAFLLCGVLVALAPCACSPDNPLPEYKLAAAESAACGTLTYENFAADFFASYCLRCHNEQLVGDANRTDAPTGINYNTLSGVRQFQSRIRLRAGVQGDMPPLIAPVPRPTEEQRQSLIEWIDCGTPADDQEAQQSS